MRYTKVGNMQLPAVAVGCMNVAPAAGNKLERFVATAMDAGLNFFDHADIYGGGACETAFGNAVRALGLRREDYFLQSKCGIVPGRMFDFSKEHILSSVDGSLRRLQTDHLDILLLHRPDALMQPEEVAEAFDALLSSGKVRAFGVSNMHPFQLQLLSEVLPVPLCANQLQFSPAHAGMISCGTEVNMLTDGGISRDGYVLDYCRLHGITVQAWSPFRYGFFEGVYLDNPAYEKLNGVLARLAEKYGTDKSAIVAAWILRYPAKMQVVTGTVNAEHLLATAKGADVTLTREEWYEVYLSAGHILP